MTRRPVSSSMFISLSYDAPGQYAECELHSGAIWRLGEFPEPLFEQWCAAASQGKFFHHWIRDIFEVEWLRDIGGRELRHAPAPGTMAPACS